MSNFFSRKRNNKKHTKIISVSAPVDGDAFLLSAVADTAFSSGMLGEGVAITPVQTHEQIVVSPVAGTLTALFPHAFALLTRDGIEVLVNIGIDTVELEGKYFEVLAEKDSFVQAGDPIIKFDPLSVTSAGFENTVILTVLNMCDFNCVTFVQEVVLIKSGETIPVKRESPVLCIEGSCDVKKD